MIDKELQAVGLQEKEAKVYVATLELGKGTAQQIAQKSGLKRPTTYVIVEDLMRQGLVSSFYEGKKQYFVAENPDRLVDLLKQQKQDVEKKEEQLKMLLPQLQSINNRQADKPVVKYYEGKDGILTMVEDYMKRSHGQKAYLAYSKDIADEVFSVKDMEIMHKLRVESKIQTKTIYTCSTGDLHQASDNGKIRVSQAEFPLSCDIAVYEDKVRIAALKNRLIGVVIEDKEIAKTFQSIFRLALIGAEHTNKK